MATLILTAVGSAIGGPVGGAIGAALGRSLDQTWLGPKARSGPRLSDLAVQGSSYGTPLPLVFGAMRVAGTLIWATALRETRHSSGGKGAPRTTSFSYSLSFAVALSARRLTGIGRIWADGKLLRGAAGDFKTPVTFRWHPGDEDQPVDPLIAAAEGVGQTPAYRAIAYAVFENFELADYGNRIPMLSFELFGDAGDVPLDRIFAAVGLASSCPTMVRGYVVSESARRAMLESLAQAVPLHLRMVDGSIEVREAGAAAPGVDRDDLGAPEPDRIARLRVVQRAVSRLGRLRALRYYDAARDYQIGVQRSWRAAGSAGELQSELPATLTATQALAIVSRVQASEDAGRSLAQISLPWRYLALRPGDELTLPDTQGLWRIETWRCEAMRVNLGLRQLARTPPAMAASAGRALRERDLPHGATVVHLLDLPALDDQLAQTPRMFVAAAGSSPGWRRAALQISFDQGRRWDDAGQTAAPALIGRALTMLSPADPYRRDDRHRVDVEMLHDQMELGEADHASLLAGANLAMLGDELIQFAHAQPLSATRWRLSGLLRGRRGSEWAMAHHALGERFVMLSRDTLAPVAVPVTSEMVEVMAIGPQDQVPPVAQAASGNALIPPSPVHLVWHRRAAGARLSWVRRSRIGWPWPDHVETPLGEEIERYAVEIQPDFGVIRQLVTTAPDWDYSADEQQADRNAGVRRLRVRVRQIGILRLSRDAETQFSID